MFVIYDGATEFEQWEQGKMLTNEHMVAGDRVLFRNSRGESIPVRAKTQDGTVVDVPNELLMNRANIKVDLVDRPSCATLFKVNAADRPADYVFVQNIITPTNESTGGNGGGGVQSDLSVNDDSDPAFVKGRTHYVTKTLETVLPETTYETYGAKYNGYYWSQSTWSGVHSYTFRVTFDGVVYDNLVSPDDNLLGNLNLYSSSNEDNGLPFVVAVGSMGSMHIVSKTEGTHTIKAEKYVIEYVKLDSNYLSPNVAKVNNATVGQAIIVKSIDENGVPTEWEAADMAGGGGDSKLIVTATSAGGSGNSETGYYKYTGVTLDKTVEEIKQAINDGKMVLVDLYGSAVCYQIFPYYDDSLTFIGFYYYYDGRAMELNNSVEIVRFHINSDSDIIAEQWPLTTKP